MDKNNQQQTTPPVFMVNDDPVPPVMEDLVNPSPATPSGSAAPVNDIVAPVVTTPQETTSPKKKFAGGKGKFIATILGITILVGGIGAGIILIQQQQNIREEAKGGDKWNIQKGCKGNGCVNDRRVNQALSNYRESKDKGQLVADYTAALADIYHESPGSAVVKVEGIDPGDYTDWRDGSGYGFDQIIDEVPVEERRNIQLPYIEGGYARGQVLTFYGNTDEGNANIDDYRLGFVCEDTTGDGMGDCVSEWDTDIAGYRPVGNFYYPVTGDTEPNNGGGGGGGGGTVPTPVPTAICYDIKAYDTNWTQLTASELTLLEEGDAVRFTVTGSASSGSFTKARFTINGIQRSEVTAKKPDTEEFYDEYTIPAGVSTFNISAQVYHENLGWK